MNASSFFSFVTCIFLTTSLYAANPKPNILLIYTDDHGWADLGAQGVNQDIHTPNIDQLAHDGVRFARGYVSAPQCTPSRCGVITGRYQQKFGVDQNGQGPLPLDEITIAKRLKPAGYLSGFVGKSHLDIAESHQEHSDKKRAQLFPDRLPNHLGFDEYWRGEMNQYYASHTLDGKPIPNAPQLVSDKRFRVNVQTEAALSFLDRRASKPDQPWFLYLAWFAPHVPLESVEPWFAKTPSNLPLERRQALSMIAAMDDGLGKIRAKLKAMGVDQNTLIFFVSDNGAPLHAGAWDGSLNEPLIGEKGMLTDGGVRVPFIAAWPSKLPSGTVYQHPVLNLDIAATANAVAGLPNDPKRLDGVNLMPYLLGENKSAPHDHIYWRWRSQAAILEFPWKLITLGNTDKYLFDVTNPDGELAINNRISQHPEIAARLESKLRSWCSELKTPGLPEDKNRADDMFFASHVTKSSESTPKPQAPGATPSSNPKSPTSTSGTQGWTCRNGNLTIKDSALIISPETSSNAPVVLIQTGFSVTGPATLTLQTKSSDAGKGTVNWRLQGEKEFSKENSATFALPAGTAFQPVNVSIPANGNIIHLRITLPHSNSDIFIQSIDLDGAAKSQQTWKFGP